MQNIINKKQQKLVKMYQQPNMKNLTKINQRFSYDQKVRFGSGAFGAVYKGYDAQKKRVIAVKLIKLDQRDGKKLYKQHDISQNEKYAQTEIQSLTQLNKNKHDNIMGYFGHHKDGYNLYLFMQLCGGGTLEKAISKRLSEIQVMKMFRQILDGMNFMNSLGKIHRDLKPANILLDQNNNVKIGDFGLTRTQSSLEMTAKVGSPLYWGPQILQGSQFYSKKCDVWSVGVILFQMLTGGPLFKAQKLKQLEKQHKQFWKGATINYSSKFHPKWSYFTNKMVRFGEENRTTFSQILKQFDECKQQMLTDIANKLGQKPEDHAKDLKLNVASPYQPITVQNILQAVMDKFGEESSYRNLTYLNNYLKFISEKTKINNKLMKFFGTGGHSYIKNVYRYMLMFLSGAISMTSLQIIQNDIQLRMINTSTKTFSIEDFEQIHYQEFERILKYYDELNQQQIDKVKKVVNKRVIQKILTEYMKRSQQKKVLQTTQNILKLVHQASQGKYASKETYKVFYKKLMNHPEVYKNQKQLSDMTQSDVKSYLYIRIIGNLDVVFPNQNFTNGDYMTMRRLEIEQMNKEEMIKFIQENHI